MLTFLRGRYLKPLQPLDSRSLSPTAQYSRYLGPPARQHQQQGTDSEPPQLNILCDERTQLYVKKAAPSLPLRARRASQRVQWLQVAKDLVSVAVGLVTVLQFIWPALQWIWEKI